MQQHRPHVDVELQDLQEFKYAGKSGTSSPREGQRRLTLPTLSEHKIILEQDEHSHKITNLYSVCCCKYQTDRRLLSFMAQFIMSVLVILFSIYKLSVNNSCPCSVESNFNIFYTSLLTGTVSIWLPAPRPLS